MVHGILSIAAHLPDIVIAQERVQIPAVLRLPRPGGHRPSTKPDAVSQSKARNVPTDLRYLTHKLVAHDRPWGGARVAIEMEVAPTDATIPHSHQDLLGSRFRDGDLFYG
jgi:hypothetical protein